MWNCMSAKHFLIFSKIFLFVMFVKFSYFSVLLGRPTANTFCFSFYLELLFMPYQNMLDVVMINWGSLEAQFHDVSCFQCALCPGPIRGATSVEWTVTCSATLLDDRVFCTSDTIWHHAISSGNPWHHALSPGRWHDALPPRHDACPGRICPMPACRHLDKWLIRTLRVTGAGGATPSFQGLFDSLQTGSVATRLLQHSTRPGDGSLQCFSRPNWLYWCIAMTLASTWYCATRWLIHNLNAHNLLINMCKKNLQKFLQLL